ncbi:MAG TPA: formyltransferase family protein, partial [Candidatus Saccharimonadales bacterium]|nr:formyltransferase family protein [Candidatus Saccharimonadales bacterium]
MKPQVVILASGNGSTAEAFIRAAQTGEVNAEVPLIIVSRSDAGIWQRIENLNAEFGLKIQGELISHKTHPLADAEEDRRGYQTAAEEAAMLEKLRETKPDLIMAMGYMKHVGTSVVNEYGWRSDYTSMFQAMMLNTHPGLLPDTAAYYGQNIQQYVLDHHLPYAGHSLHLISDGYDEGPIVAEYKVPVEPNDTAETLFERVQASEKAHLPH